MSILSVHAYNYIVSRYFRRKVPFATYMCVYYKIYDIKFKAGGHDASSAFPSNAYIGVSMLRLHWNRFGFYSSVNVTFV